MSDDDIVAGLHVMDDAPRDNLDIADSGWQISVEKVRAYLDGSSSSVDSAPDATRSQL